MKKYKAKRIEIEKIVISLYVATLLTALPLTMNNAYFDVIQTKKYVFQVITIVYIGILAVALLFSKIRGATLHLSFNIVDCCWTIMPIYLLINTVFSSDVKKSISGEDGWGLGLSFWFLLLCCYFFVSMVGVYKSILVFPMIMTSLVVIIIALLNCLNFDVFNFVSILLEREKYNYISTIGNINWYGEYVNILLVIVSFIWLNSTGETCLTKFIEILIPMLIFTAVCCGSDIALIGIILINAYIFMEHLFFGVKQKMIVYLFVECCIFVGINILYNYHLLFYPLNTLQKTFISKYCCGAIGALIIVELIVRKKYIKNIIYIIAACSLCVYIKTFLHKYLYFSDSWGTNRGYIFCKTLELYKSLTFKEKLLGVGLDRYGTVMFQKYGNALEKYLGGRLINAHNWFFQLLITIGLFGSILFILTIIITLRNSVAISSNNLILKAIKIGIFAFMIQGLFNNMQPLGMTFFFVLLGLFNYETKTFKETTHYK